MDNKLEYIYDIEFKIGDVDYSHSVLRIEQLCSIDQVMDIFSIKFIVDSTEILEDQLFGHETVNLKIKLTSYEQTVIEEIDLELLILKTNFKVTPKTDGQPNSEHTNKPAYNPQPITIVGVLKKAFEIFYSPINNISQNNNGLTPIKLVEKLVDKVASGITKDINNKNANTNEIFQILIPPTNLIKSIKYINGKYPIYKGTKPFIQITSDEGKLLIWDPRSKLQDKEAFFVTLLTMGLDDSDEIRKCPGPDKNKYFTYSNIKTNYKGNESITSTGGMKHTFITKPPDEWFKLQTVDFSTIFKENGVTEKNSTFKFNETLNKLRKFHPNISQHMDDNMPREFLSKFINSSTELAFNIHGNMPWLALTRVGSKVTMESIKDVYQKYAGSYILKTSLLTWTKENNPHFQCGSYIQIFRGYYE